jgi:signal recognition particle subunit SRP54
MFESLSKKLDAAFKTRSGQGRLTEENMKAGLEKIRQALLEADVNYNVA